MSMIYAEWISSKTGEKYRVQYPILIDSPMLSRDQIGMYEEKGVKIDDPAIRFKAIGHRQKNYKKNHYAIYASSNTQIPVLISVLKNYIEQYYTPKNKTLITEICL